MEYLHLGLPKEVVELLEAKARQSYLKKSDVARQYLMKSLEEETVVELRKKKYSVSLIGETLKMPTLQIMKILDKTGIDDELYPDAEDEKYGKPRK